ncbi:aspartate ammonia-lyase [Acidipropionibacterium jensenii]|uniref:Aspartate ammonia-lyase n=1 Tax=Acidipropionibacterium jensenii TaxID=1749 RepID=A0A448P2E6_9ACTN|nr:aspartate ammonia-lyase [Acidipropionibacterium jensenii]AZZ39139.1 aspartate ammonia-lyase [Acidipropionibacterium jensenii]MDN5977472.1 aspartate ammonia-lyase [Acidipropionibacterium jensenii]MDN5996346.1 aspartate ammonia-lyase [Acidipropionibacterium jensenii]MDN6020919.1 aspartate ammonia-lyase [Acidipropionibacterium jensenii]MDN6426766.1 aspartate ammonia-lyase [Acidipropionibacterium jensenii]
MTQHPRSSQSSRVEVDLLGEVQIDDAHYWGINTARALENFPITSKKIGNYPQFVDALAVIKQAAATVNSAQGLVPARAAEAIIAGCQRIRAREFDDQFVVGTIQGGAGTSTNMNANEVVANVALEELGLAKGRYDVVDPHNHVNCCQSTNDVYPSAIKIALLLMLDDLSGALRHAGDAFAAKAEEFSDVLKLGRTQLQDAVPMTLGQEFGTYAVMLRNDESILAAARKLLTQLNIGGTAIGTGINTPAAYAPAMITELNRLTGLELSASPDLVEATQDVGGFVQLSGVLKRIAVKISKICNDLRLLSSGPRAGLGEINLPAVQAGSSIMPGKVNPVIPEMVNQVAFEIVGHDVTISMAAEAGQLQLNAFEPIIAHLLFEEIRHLQRAMVVFTDRCITGITANEETLREEVWRSVSIVTALSPALGYRTATRVAQQALAEGRTVGEIILEEHLLDKDALASALAPEHLIHPWMPTN